LKCKNVIHYALQFSQYETSLSPAVTHRGHTNASNVFLTPKVWYHRGQWLQPS